MADIRVRYFGPLRERVGKRFEKISIDDSATLSELLEKLTNIHGSEFRNFVFDNSGKLRQGIAFAINGDSIPSSRLGMVKGKNVREFVILPPISGGTEIFATSTKLGKSSLVS
jgi:MoaD family protein